MWWCKWGTLPGGNFLYLWAIVWDYKDRNGAMHDWCTELEDTHQACPLLCQINHPLDQNNFIPFQDKDKLHMIFMYYDLDKHVNNNSVFASTCVSGTIKPNLFLSIEKRWKLCYNITFYSQSSLWKHCFAFKSAQIF